jgi:hypothetical protein
VDVRVEEHFGGLRWDVEAAMRMEIRGNLVLEKPSKRQLFEACIKL